MLFLPFIGLSLSLSLHLFLKRTNMNKRKLTNIDGEIQIGFQNAQTDFTTEAVVGHAVPVSMDNSVRKLMDTVQMDVRQIINNRCVKVFETMWCNNESL